MADRIKALRQATSEEELWKLINQNLHEKVSVDFAHTTVRQISPKVRPYLGHLLTINRLGFWTFESQLGTQKEVSGSNKLEFNRSYLSGWMRREQAHKLASSVTKSGTYLVTVHESSEEKNCLYFNGVKHSWDPKIEIHLNRVLTRGDDDKFVETIESKITGWINDLDATEGFFENPELVKLLQENYVEMTIVDAGWFSSKNIFGDCLRAMANREIKENEDNDDDDERLGDDEN